MALTPGAGPLAAPVLGLPRPGMPPAFEEIIAAAVPTLRHVPVVARCLARTVSAAATLNTTTSWQGLFVLPKAVLCVPSRGGRRHQAQAAQATCRRCQRWLDGERGALWDDLDMQRAPTHPKARQGRCFRLAAEGELSRACAALVEPPPLPPNAETFAQRQAKHPVAALPDLAQLSPSRPAAVPEFESELVMRAVRTLKRTSGAR